MNDSSVNSALYRYWGCVVPIAAVAGALVILRVIVLLLGDKNFTKIDFIKVPGLPDNLELQNFYELTSASFWWLFFVFTVWIAASIAIITTFVVVHKSFIKRPERIIAIRFLSVCIIALVSIFWLIDASFISAQDTIQHLKSLATGLRDLIEMTTALALVALIAILICTSMLLYPPNDKNNLVPKMQWLNILLYTGAALLVAWILQSRALYSFGAASLIVEQQQTVEQIAPTISLVVGGVFSIVLGLMYVCSYLWLLNRYVNLTNKAEREKYERDNPKHFYRKSWTAVLAAMGPMLPGFIEILTVFSNSN